MVARALLYLFTRMRELTLQLSPPGGGSQLAGVRPGWGGVSNDLSDSQWRAFRSHLPLLCLVALGSSLLSRLVRPLSRPLQAPPARRAR